MTDEQMTKIAEWIKETDDLDQLYNIQQYLQPKIESVEKETVKKTAQDFLLMNLKTFLEDEIEGKINTISFQRAVMKFKHEENPEIPAVDKNTLRVIDLLPYSKEKYTKEKGIAEASVNRINKHLTQHGLHLGISMPSVEEQQTKKLELRPGNWMKKGGIG